MTSKQYAQLLDEVEKIRRVAKDAMSEEGFTFGDEKVNMTEQEELSLLRDENEKLRAEIRHMDSALADMNARIASYEEELKRVYTAISKAQECLTHAGK